MNFWIENSWDSLLEVMKKTDIISINDEEARQISGEYSLVRAARKIHTIGPQTVIIKKGEHGALVFHDNNMFLAPALPLENVIDPTGAGDTFIGGFAAYLHVQETYSFEAIKKATIHGCATASVCVEQFGLEALVKADKSTIISRLDSLKKLSQIDSKGT
ncbi:sugar kinase [Elysia marginata]|uniref:Sugar kinase n=1 Tax=Elysia marginata TaxID=1093978 RepID=A0AAV4FWM2_9GAST|nr:sugar kinase [Elysia marginata]